MKEKRFSSAAELAAAARDLISETIRAPYDYPMAVMLAGGKTPLAAYEAVAQSGIQAAGNVHAVFSDERMVPTDSPDSNYGNAAGMLHAAGIPDARVIRVQTDLPLENAARRYHEDIDHFLQRGGQIALGLLGLGADGHTASLFTREGVIQASDAWAIPVVRSDGHDRVSVTRRLLLEVKRIVFLVTGPDKRAIIDKMIHRPSEVIAGMAVEGARNVELWTARQSVLS